MLPFVDCIMPSFHLLSGVVRWGPRSGPFWLGAPSLTFPRIVKLQKAVEFRCLCNLSQSQGSDLLCPIEDSYGAILLSYAHFLEKLPVCSCGGILFQWENEVGRHGDNCPNGARRGNAFCRPHRDIECGQGAPGKLNRKCQYVCRKLVTAHIV